MDREKIISEFLKNFKPKEEQSWKSCYFFAYNLKKEHNIDVKLVEGISRIKKIDYWIVNLQGTDLDIHARAIGEKEDFIDNPELTWTLEEFERDNF
ncbi:MAG: hypothetical protein CMC67_03365 [Flavobacteriaceae bacterium]|nr:hypothetical protein [Flavobacteriaceae bacterium]